MAELKSKDIEKEVGKSMKKTEGKLIKLKLKEIKPYKKNAKIHTEKQVAGIRDSIINFGYNDLIAVDENNIILEGHGRLRAMYMIDTTGQKIIPVWQIKGRTESEKKAYRIAHNKLNLATGFDVEILKEEFHELEDTENFKNTGFEVSEITRIWDKKASNKDLTDVQKHQRELNKDKSCPNCGYDLTKIKE